MEYLPWRQEDRAKTSTRGTIRRDVVRDELLAIRKFFRFALERGLCSERNVPYWRFDVEKEGAVRRRITQRDYAHFLNCIRIWKAKANNPKEHYHRELLHHFVLVIASSGLRSGELFGLKNRDVEIRHADGECLLAIRAETSKVRKGRQITVTPSYGGRATSPTPINYLIRWMKKHQKHKDPNDLVFSPYTDGARSARDIYYHMYEKLRVDLKEVGLEWFDTYHCRHFWITNRLYAGGPIHLVAKAAGTSVKEIEQTYSNVLTEIITRDFGRKRVIYRDNGSPVVVTTISNASK